MRIALFCLSLSLAGLLLAAPVARADQITDANARINDLIIAEKLPPPRANRALAIAHVAAYEAGNAITHRYPTSGRTQLTAVRGASLEMAFAAALHTSLLELLPGQKAQIDADFDAARAKIADGAARTNGMAVGEEAARQILARSREDGAMQSDAYVPFTQPGRYVPTTTVAVPYWGQRKPWVLTSGDEFRPGPPPALDSAIWARDYNEIRAIGAKDSRTRTAEQTAIARFWEATQPTIYYPLARAVAAQPGRDPMRNARLFATVGMAIDDALIAVFDAKYAYNFWRPVTAIRNGDADGNEATTVEAGWTPFIETPMHPEYPCAHCIVSSALATVLAADIGRGPMPVLATTSPTAPGVTRTWTSLPEFVQEVSNARIYDGVHFRNSTEVGTALGRKVGEKVVKQMFR